MSVLIRNDWIIIDKNDKSYFPLSLNLSYTITDIRKKRGKSNELTRTQRTETLYKLVGDYMFLPAGVLKFIESYISDSEIIDERTHSKIEIPVENIGHLEDYKGVLPGITLRTEQLFAIRKILFHRHCLVQMTTGAGKTEVMCAVVKILTNYNNNICPTTLVMEPTSRLVQDTIKRFETYGIKATMYNDNRKIIENCVNVCHPTSVGNDLESNDDLLDKVEVLLGDECHHFSSESFRIPTYSMSNLSYSIGVSASAISQEHVGCKNIDEFTYNEALVIGATGPLVFNIKAKGLIEDGKLATPILLMVTNRANQYMPESSIGNWHETSKIRLESDVRTRLIAYSAEIFHNEGRKCLILVHTRRWAREIMKVLDEYGIGDYARASFGGGYFERYNGKDFEPDNEDVFEKYKSGEYTILIGTSHLYEGADVPNLDVLILAYGGAGERLQVQGLGRVLRKTKTGKYAYIVDFTDSEDPILSKQSRNRMERYRKIIGIPEDNIYYDIPVKEIRNIFKSLEKD